MNGQDSRRWDDPACGDGKMAAPRATETGQNKRAAATKEGQARPAIGAEVGASRQPFLSCHDIAMA